MNSTTKIIAGVAVLALLFAAVGYATYTGSAKTYNDGNEVQSEYATIAFDDWNPFTGAEAKIDFDTYTYNSGTSDNPATATVYQPMVDSAKVSQVAISDTVTKTGYKVGEKTLTLSNKTDSDIASFTLAVTSTAVLDGDDFAYYLQIEGANNYKEIKPLNTTSLTFNVTGQSIAATTGDADFTITLFLVYSPTMVVDNPAIGPAHAPEQGETATWVESTPEEVAKVKIAENYGLAFEANTFAA